MTKKHYEAIAKILNSHFLRTADKENLRVLAIAEEIAEVCKQDNANFDSIRFMSAVMKTYNEVKHNIKKMF